ncbi:Putative two-component system sensor protein [Janibacter sp. HTCC2649]|uniref:HAMP domain-containing sensor histidine kinase n=1 Tax=Janibacter sp. HTCC2649 TaxID=313589 RepID=UPI000066ECA2|nr:HAMP domain-containing sensor histidine kinase [Janibacter sp. HTCC2649]EAP98716.1 Putative two-component system sensor protein [Janibacter sp. HTCC2649]
MLIAQTLVLVACAVTSWLVASVVGPSIFHDHLQQAGVGHSPSEAAHVEEAFGSALLISLGVALTASVLLALGVTAFFTRRVQRSTAAVAHSASRIAGGNYQSQVPSPGLGAEFDQLATTINDLAQRLGDVETTRRRLLADLAHEMRTPLGSIEAHLEAIEDGIRSLDHATLEVLHGNTTRLQRLAEDITAVARAEEGGLDLRPVPTDTTTLVESATAAAHNAYDVKQIALDVDTRPTGTVLVDPDRMAQVLANLLDNALQHTPPGGRVRVAVRKPDPDWVEITVTDNGEGIDAHHLVHVFERFYRADPARSRVRGGSGIGLTISKALVEAHGGGLSASSPGPGGGAEFTLRLPLDRA